MKIINTIYSAFILSIIFISCENNSPQSTTQENPTPLRKKSPEEIRNEISQDERSLPFVYLSAKGSYKENYWGDKFKVSCTITNKATLVTYKDAKLMVSYYSKTKTLLGSDSYVIYEFFPPLSSKTIDLEIGNYKNAYSFELLVREAIPVPE